MTSSPSAQVDEIADGIYRISTPIPPTVIPGGFTFNQFLIDDDEPLLFHTGPRKLFPIVSAAVASVLPLERLRHISFSHFEADECGSLNEFLAAAPNAAPLCGQVAAMTSVDDVADRAPRVLADGEALELGKHRVTWHDTPHLPHAWECGFLSESTTSTLFCGDLFTQGGDEHESTTERDILAPSMAMLGMFDYYSHTKNARPMFDKLIATRPRLLACMHGAAWRGDGAALLEALASELV
ncbi:MAG: flavorubredoxin [Chlamydiales bacterium]|jgi:flavorubredoxin